LKLGFVFTTQLIFSFALLRFSFATDGGFLLPLGLFGPISIFLDTPHNLC
jgi:hypothetical protein